MARRTEEQVTLTPRTSNRKRAKNKVLGVLLALLIIVIVIVADVFATADSRKTISVVKLNTSISANTLITENMLTEYKMNYKEYNNYGTQKFQDGTVRGTIVKWDDKDLIVGKKYSSYYMRENTVLFWDSMSNKGKRSNSYLYNMQGELINIKMSTSDFGTMVIPGDTLNIYVTYTDNSYSLPTESEYNNGDMGNRQVTKTEKLFNEVTILDMLNSSGNSIFDIYYDFVAKSNAQRQALLKDEDWKASVQPSTILLEVTTEEALHFREISAKSPSYTMTLLPRTQSNSMLDSLAEIQYIYSGEAKQ